MTLLVGRSLLTVAFDVGALLGGHEASPGAWREVRIEETAQPRCDLGQQFATDRDEPVTSPAEPEASPPHRAFVVGLGPVLVEERGPDLRLHPQLVGGAAHRCGIA
ncbi:hypothetical protein ASE14_08760 [Agromyces sp. Root81]|nr:hypothetical protein [Agromyces sp. Root81]KRC61031.1 hypothetical protein ASE14_08760 [Agromyces sp. Root81]